MLALRPSPAWLCATAFAVALTVAPIAYHFNTRPPRPETIAQLLAHLEDRQCRLKVVPAALRSGDVSQGVYLCRPAYSRDPRALGRDSFFSDRWTGVVLCEQRTGNPVECATRAEAWGVHGLYSPPFLFFGDPELLTFLAEHLRR